MAVFTITCACGMLSKIEGLGRRGVLIPTPALDAFLEELNREVVEYVEAVEAGRHADWVSNLYGRGPEAGETHQMFLGTMILDMLPMLSARGIFRCAGCGRLWIEPSPYSNMDHMPMDRGMERPWRADPFRPEGGRQDVLEVVERPSDEEHAAWQATDDRLREFGGRDV